MQEAPVLDNNYLNGRNAHCGVSGSLRRRVRRWLEDAAPVLLPLVAFLIPLRLSFTLVVLVPCLILWLFSAPQIISLMRRQGYVIFAMLFFLGYAGLTSGFGIAPLSSLIGIVRLAFTAMTILLYADLLRPGRASDVVFALVLGQSTAAFHSVIDTALPGVVSGLLIGKVTESGQLALTLPVAVGLLFSLLRARTDSVSRITVCYSVAMSVVLPLAAFMLGGFGSPSAQTFAAIALGTAVLLMVYDAARLPGGVGARAQLLMRVCLPLLVAALVVNLKRGPWCGLVVALGIFLLLNARRLLVPLCLVALSVVFFVQPVRSRLLNSDRDFFVTGGRSDLWDIGAELLSTYPLGIGYGNTSTRVDNRRFIQRFSDDIPDELRHFHNNLLQIAVETGWVGVGLFLWWAYHLIRAGLMTRLKGHDRLLAQGLGFAFLAWQIAGTVEYNFGDSEVLILVCMLAGVLCAASTGATAEPKDYLGLP